MRHLFYIIGIAIIITISAGCGGDGGSDLIKGVANIHHDATHPTVGFVVSSGDALVSAAPGTPIARSTSDWQDISFAVPPPPEPYHPTTYSVACYNDLDNDRLYETDELLGFADNFLYWNGYQWEILDHNGNLLWDDAFEHSGKGNIFIDAEFMAAIVQFNKSGSTDTKQNLERKQIDRVTAKTR